MKHLFGANIKWAGLRRFVNINLVVSCILLFILGFQVKGLPIWIVVFISSILFFSLFIEIIGSINNIPYKIEIFGEGLIFYLPFKKTEYNFNDIRYYATASTYYQRGAYCHSVIFEFSDNNRICVTSIAIEDYNKFLKFVESLGLSYYGFIGKYNWKRKGKPISKKWITYKEEEDILLTIGKEPGYLFIYVLGIIFLILNFFIFFGLVFGFENLKFI
jgi:hypothetical protein